VGYVRNLVGALLWISAFVLAIATLARAWGDPDPCAPTTDWTSWAPYALGLLAAAATFASLRIRPVGALVIALVVGAGSGFGLLFLLVVRWIGECAN